jgi:hypothetical protein
MGGPSSGLICPTASTARADGRHTSHITKPKGTEMKIAVIGRTGLIGSKLVGEFTRVSHA